MRPISCAPSSNLPRRRATTITCMEGFDGPWKGGSIEGGGGRLLGPVRRHRPSQIRLHRPAAQFSGMARLCASGGGPEPVAGILVLGRMPKVRQTGYLVMGGLIALVSTGLLALIDATALEYIDPTDIIAIIAMSPLVLLACAIILTEGIEMAASAVARGSARGARRDSAENSPRVSIHVPTYNEPPQMVIETLNALARLDYDNYEVIVLDNNTPDPEVWRPVEAHCKTPGCRASAFSISTTCRASRRARSTAPWR